MNMSLFDLLEKRHSIYALGRNTKVTVDDVEAALKKYVPLVPTAFNSQSQRLVLLDTQTSDKVWALIDNVQKDVMPKENYEGRFKALFANAREGLGTILFFEDTEAVVSKMPANDERREVYKEQGDANNQLVSWLVLTELGLGASLQHLNIGHAQGHDKSILDLLGLPASYELIAEMPFGSIEAPAGSKPKEDVSTLVSRK